MSNHQVQRSSSGLNAPMFSKINWTQAVGLLATGLAFFGIDMDEGTRAAVVTFLGSATMVVTWVWRTWFTG